MSTFVDTLKQLGPSRLGIMAAIILGLLVFFVFVSLRVSAPEMKLLYGDLSPNDSSAVAAALEEHEIPYQISPDGGRVVVPEDDIGRARMLLAAAGIPNGGSMGYEIFDKDSGFGTTNFVQNINQVRALEGELARTIGSLENVRSARVHLVLPQRALFSRESKPSSASVFLSLRSGGILERAQVVAIQSLVASSVPDLKPSNVSIIDSDGNLLARGGEEETNLLTLRAEEMRRGYESQLISKVEDQVARIVGYGNVRASITAEINFDRISTNEELFDPEGQVIRSTQVTEENSTERESAPEDVSIENNLPGVGGDLLADELPSAESNRVEEVTNFEISRTVRNTVREAGEIKRLSVAVLVDGKYSKNEEGDRVYTPRTAEEMEQITSLVRSAVGYDEGRGDALEVVNMQFAEVEAPPEITIQDLIFGFERSAILDTAELLTVVIMIILVIMLVLQPMVNRLLSTPAPEIDTSVESDLLAAGPASPALAPPDEEEFHIPEEHPEDKTIDIQGVEGRVKASAVKKVEEIVQNYPSETVSVLRSWMTQE